jgi:hypothetical protein
MDAPAFVLALVAVALAEMAVFSLYATWLIIDRCY